MSGNKRTQDLSGTSFPEDTPISNTGNYHQACTCMTGVDLASDHKDPHCPIHGEPPKTTLTTYSGDSSVQPHPSNTEQLREAISKVLGYEWPLYFNHKTKLDQIEQLVATHTAEAVRLSRIDEVTSARALALIGDEASLNDYTADRLAQLKHQQGGK